jgi:uncharacterized protein (DUF2147 family)
MKILITFFMLAFASVLSAEDVKGFWKRLNGKTGNTQCVISIYEYKGLYYGRIIGTFHSDGKMKDNIYSPIYRAENVDGSPYYCGLDLLFDLKTSGSKYRGKIVDPRSGNIYTAVIWNKEGNLIIRGELFIFGRSETWFPLEEGDFPPDFKMPDSKQFVPTN